MNLTKAFKKFFDISVDGLFITDRENRFLEVNQSYCDLVGWSRKELLTRHFTDIDTKEETRIHFENVVTSGRDILKTSHKRKDGTSVEVEISTTLLESGMEYLFLNHVSNISIHKGTEKAILETENYRKLHEYARCLIESSFDMIVAVDSHRNIVEFNKAAQKTFGYAKEEVLGKNISILYSDPEQTRIPADVLQKKGHFTSEVLNKRKNGELFQSLVTATLIKDSQGKILGTMGVSRDITEQKSREEELRNAKIKAEKASRAKDEFFGNMTHEIRTPLNSIIGFTELGLETNSFAEMGQYLSIIKESSDFLLILLNSVLDYSKIEANKLVLYENEFHFRMAVESVTETMSAQAQQKDIELLCHISRDVPKYLIGDSPRLKQVLVNLIGNAVKFTEKGEIIIDVRINPPSGESQKIRKEKIELLFSIKDTGIGIPPDNIQSIFKSFVQVDSTTTRKFGGTGLGLTIASRLVELMSGRIWVESEVGKGSTFYFTVSLSRSLKKIPVEEKWNLTGSRSLIIDRNEMSRFILREMLEEWGFEVNEAEKGLSGINELQTAFSDGKPYDLAIFENRLPDLPGFKVAETIKENLLLAKHSIVMLNIHHRSGDIDKVNELGLTGYILKPVKKEMLQKLIAKSFGLKFYDPFDDLEESERVSPPQRIVEEEEKSTADSLIQKTSFPIKLEKLFSNEEVLLSPESKDEHLLLKRKAFAKTMTARIDILKKVMEHKNFSEIEKRAQEIKKESSDIGAALMKKEAFRIVLASRNEDVSRCEILLERLVKEFIMTKNKIISMDK